MVRPLRSATRTKWRQANEAEQPIYFMTEDEISEGLDQTTAIGTSYEAVEEPAKVEGRGSDRPPGARGSPLQVRPLLRGQPHRRRRRGSWGRQGKEEFELYDLEADPSEENNLAARSLRNLGKRDVKKELGELLTELRSSRALTPHNRSTPT